MLDMWRSSGSERVNWYSWLYLFKYNIKRFSRCSGSCWTNDSIAGDFHGTLTIKFLCCAITYKMTIKHKIDMWCTKL